MSELASRNFFQSLSNTPLDRLVHVHRLNLGESSWLVYLESETLPCKAVCDNIQVVAERRKPPGLADSNKHRVACAMPLEVARPRLKTELPCRVAPAQLACFPRRQRRQSRLRRLAIKFTPAAMGETVWKRSTRMTPRLRLLNHLADWFGRSDHGLQQRSSSEM